MKKKFTHSELGADNQRTLRSSNTITLLSLTIVILFSLFTTKLVGQICCPEFKLKDAVEICPPEGACHVGTSPGGPGKSGMAACKLTTHQYTVYPNISGYTYVWTIIGGTPSNPTGNPVNILWGSGSSGIIKVVISNLGIGGYCLDSLTQEICLIDGPKANFTLNNDTVCMNIPVHFTNTSSGGSSYLWDFGDGTTSNLASPPDHSYALPGTYTVLLTATNASAGGPPAGDQRGPCGCRDTISKTVTVLNGAGPSIDLDCCFGTVCAGDTSSFCTSVVCGTYNWSVTGGTIVSGSGTNCIKVKWNATYSVPTTVSLSVPGCGPAPCPGTTTLSVPVLYPNLPISGPNPLCVGASGTFFLPVLPGTFYLWTTTAPPGFFSFNQVNRNSASVNITFNQAGTFLVKCQYNNPLAGCSGNSTFVVDVLPVFSFTGDENVCEGTPSTYYANGTATWAVNPTPGTIVPAGITNTETITFNIPGTYTITATANPTGIFCNLNAVKVVRVVAKPLLNNITGPALVCPGKNFTYKISSNTQGSDFVWGVSGGGSIKSQMGADKDSVIVKLIGGGPWTITVFQKIELSPGVYCQSLTKTLVVNKYPAPVVTGNQSVCVDAVETYIASGSTPPGGIQWTVSPSYQGSVILGQGTNSVNIRWHGTPATALVTASHCGGSGSLPVTIVNPPIVSDITANGPTGYCLPAMPNNLQLSTSTGFSSYQWYLNNSAIGGANSFFYNIPNATFTGVGVYYFSVLVSNGSCSVLKNAYVQIDSCNGVGGGGGLPNPIICSINDTIIPNPACENQPVTFIAIPSGPGFSYAWDFGDAATSFVSPTEHTYVSAGTDTVTLTATFGSCVVVVKKVITINPTPYCFITASDTIFCPGSSVTLTACTGMSSYQWYREGAAISGATSMTYNANMHGEYEVEVTNNFGCANRSNSIYIYVHTPPVAKITGVGSYCEYPGTPVNIPLSAFIDPAYVYDWSSNSGATFTANNSNISYNTNASFTLPAILPATYYFVVKVTDTVTGCISRDTLCVTFYETPPLNITYVAGCDTTSYVLTPTPINPILYHYQWSNGKTTPVITVKAPGTYSLTVTDKATGCSATVLAATIYAKPDLTLFPTGCDTIMCKTDTLHMYIPLPLNALPPFNTYAAAYPNINWYDNGNYGTPIASGPSFNLVTTGSGNHQISVVVQNYHGCSDTAGVFCLTAICGDIEFDCPAGPILLPCNSTHPTNADALGAVGAITDSCPGPLTITVTGGTATPVTGCWWTATFTIIATNGCGQADTCFITYNWKEDIEPPSFTHCPGGPILLPCNAPHPTIADALAAAGTAMDNCPGTVNVLVTGGIPTPTTGCNWTTTFNITATDSCNNTSVCTIIYNWKEDLIPPQFAHCPSGPIFLPCNAQHPVEDEPLLEVGAITDNCPDPINVVMTGGVAIPDGGCRWTATYTITATDACGNSNVCYVTYKWKEDHILPAFAHCPARPIQLPCNAPHPTEADAFGAAGAVTDNCPGTVDIQLTGGVATPTTGCNWTAIFTITATDSCGNAAVCSITYNWKEDLMPPQFAHCPQGPVTLPCNTKPILGEILYEIGPITDNCPGHIDIQVTGGIPTPTTGCSWTATYTITATDSCGNVNVCTATYNWKEDHQAPQFTHCPAGPILLPCNSPRPKEADVFAAAGDITDNCPGVIIQLSGGVPTPTTGCNWTSTFTITATDSCGNSTSCIITYNWKEDLIPPQFAHCPQGPVTLPCNTKPILGEVLYEIGPITDNCPGHIDIQVTGGIPTPTIGCSWTATYTITATDSCGNVNVCTATYNWKEDHRAPVFAHCPQGPINLTCNSPRPTLADALVAAGDVTDNCPGTVNVQVTGGVATQLEGCSWTSTYSITATDSCGNVAVCSITFNWKEDTTPPVYAHCPIRPITLPCNSPRPTIPEAILAAGPVTDNCYVDFINVTDGGVIAIEGCWFTETFTLTATDGCGNVTVCHVTYRWKEDLTAPQFAHCPASAIELPCNAPRPTLASVLATAGSVTDNCPGNVFVVDCLLPVDGHYDSPTVVSYGSDIAIRNFVLANFSDCYPPPSAIGQTEIHDYSSMASFELSHDGGNNWMPVQAPAEITIRITKTDETETERFFDTEILSMIIAGGTLPQPETLRESPSKSSLGQIKIQSGSGEFQISSFFDVFTELSTDEGQSWIPANLPHNVNLSGPIIVHVTPGPVSSTTGCGFTQTYSLSATDACGNVTVCNVTYNWKVDHTPPVFLHCPDGPITLPGNSSPPTVAQALAAAGEVTDNCPGLITITVTDSGPIAGPNCTWTETFTITATDACGNFTECTVIYKWTDFLNPPVILGEIIVCAGTSGVTYTTEHGMSSYFWTISAGGTITAGTGTNTITVTWNTPGLQTVSVNYININGCTAATPTVYKVKVNPLPVPSLTGPTPVCNFWPGNVYFTEPGMFNYLWTIPAGATVTGGGKTSDNTVTIKWTIAGTKIIKVNYTDAYGCTAVNLTQFAVVVKPSPIPAITGPVSTCVNINTVYSTVPWQSNYVWTISPEGTILNGQGTKTVTVKWTTVDAHWIGLNYTNLNGCSAQDPTIRNVTVNTCKLNPIGTDTTNNIVINTIIGESDNIVLNIYPNPNDGSFTAIISAENPDTYQLQIYSNLGVRIFELRELKVTGTIRQKVDIRNVVDGIYNFILTNKNRSIQKRVIIRK